MSLLLDGTNGVSDVDGTAATPAIRGTDANTGISFGTDTVTISTGGVARVTTDASGNVGVGTDSPNNSSGYKTLSINGTTGGQIAFQTNSSGLQFIYSTSTDLNFYNSAAGNLIFHTNNTERARIDSSGNLLVGTTSASARLTVVSSTANSSSKGIQINNSAGTELLAILSDGAFYTGTASSSPYNTTTGAGANVHVDSAGRLFRSTSSLKYKKEVNNATRGLAEVLQLRPVTYKGKSAADGDKVFGGLIAEEVHEAGLTEFVQYADDGSPDALAYGNMVSLCIKAIQEQQAIISAMETRLAALEA
jgi:hypothetical protein